MTTISAGIKQSIKVFSYLFNQQIVKEGIKNIAGTITFVFGLVEFYNIVQIRKIRTKAYTSYPKWVQVTHKMMIVCAKVSLILSAGVTRPGVFILSSLVGGMFSTSQLNRAFGPNTIFTINPWHPRHVVSIIAVLLALPSVAQSIYKCINWTYKGSRQYLNVSVHESSTKNDVTNNKIRLMALFNTITSRPVLHLGNQLVSLILRKI